MTGGSGFLGSSVVAGLAASENVEFVIGADIRRPSPGVRVPGVLYGRLDVTDAPELPELLRSYAIDTVVHLASIVNPGKHTTVAQEFAVDVEGSRTVFDACVEAGIKRVVVSSSGAAYGYHRDSPEWLTETDPLRGNDDFPYSRHKRMVEEMLAELRETAPQLTQTVFRIGTILGPDVNNQITALWDARRVLTIVGPESPFVFVCVDDVVGRTLRLTPHGPAQVKFLRYRPVLDNTALKDVFGFTPHRTSREAFEGYIEARPQR
ncbi:UDP-glucose 4-epimerase [Leifsonia rubra CMS 76R]|nr:UDP-glucose 4-epimerase [Leifsonia rubra CMS 76R]